jgi:hypothetical protein
MKNCGNCGAEIAESALFCSKCGSSTDKVILNKENLKKPNSSKIVKPTKNSSDEILMIFAVVFIVTSAIQFLMSKFIHDWYRTPFNEFYYFVRIIIDLSYFLPVLAIKNLQMRTIGIILVGIPVIYWISSIILNIMI